MGLLLNLGCNVNLFPKPWINVDAVPPPDDLVVAGLAGCWREHADFQTRDFLSLDWLGPSTVEKIQLDFVLEHLHIDRVPDFLYQLARVLIEGGKIEARVPDGALYARQIIEWENRGGLGNWMKFRTANFELLNPTDSGPLSAGPAAHHKSIWTERTAKLLFEAQGFTVSFAHEGDRITGLSTLVIHGTRGYTPAGKLVTAEQERPLAGCPMIVVGPGGEKRVEHFPTSAEELPGPWEEAKVESELKAARPPIAEPWKDVSNKTPLKAFEEVKALPTQQTPLEQQLQREIDLKNKPNDRFGEPPQEN